jgi:hypothetical protein
MMLTCNAADGNLKEVLDYRKTERERIRANILEALKSVPATVGEIPKFIGKIVTREIFYHYDAESGFSCYGHLGDVKEVFWNPEVIRRNLTSLRKLGLVDYLDDGRPPFLWYARSK